MCIYVYVCTFRTQAGFKEREDRIGELEEFINDQVTELDKIETAMKQTADNKQKLEKDHQKLNEYYDTAKVRKCICNSIVNINIIWKIQNCMKSFLNQACTAWPLHFSS